MLKHKVLVLEWDEEAVSRCLFFLTKHKYEIPILEIM